MWMIVDIQTANSFLFFFSFSFPPQVYSAGPEFKGIKMIPPGVHFVFYSSSTKYVPLLISFVLVWALVFVGLFVINELNVYPST